MILKGELRRLEVLVEGKYWRDGNRWLNVGLEGLDGDVGEGSNWIALKRVLKDPDLEVARLGTFSICGGDGIREEDITDVVYRDFR